MTKKIAILIFLIFGQICLSQNSLKGKFHLVNNPNNIIEFFENNKFRETTILPKHPKENALIQKGDFIIKSDSLVLIYDHSYENYEQDVEKQKIVITEKSPSKTDSIKIELNSYNSDNNYNDFGEPLFGVKLEINGKTHIPNYDEPLIVSLKKEERIKIVGKVENSVPVEIEINGNYNHKLKLYMNPSIIDLSKEDVIGYKIEYLDTEKIILILKNKGVKTTIEYHIQK